VKQELQILDRRSAASRLLEHLDQRSQGVAAQILAPLGSLYAGGAAWSRRFRPDRQLPETPRSIGVGNLRVGGTGKTPLVGALVEELRARGLRVGVLSRGHRAEGGGDEPQWLESLGAEVELGANRARAFTRLAERDVDVVILDDALQTRWRPQRCFGLCLYRDRQRPPRSLPAGPAREAPAAAQRRADLWIWRHDGAFPGQPVPKDASGHEELHFRLEPVGLQQIRGGATLDLGEAPFQRAVLVCGIARPESFEGDAAASGLPLVGSLRFDDHWSPSRGDLRRAVEFAARVGGDAFMCSEKNAARLSTLDCGLPTYVLRSRVVWWGGGPLVRVPEWFGL
jgi:tetraacyldisaccharide 4'-kinase